MKSILFLLAAAIVMFAGCSGFKPVKMEHDEKDKPLDYREGNWLPKNS